MVTAGVENFVTLLVGSVVEFSVAPFDRISASDCRLPPSAVPAADGFVYLEKRFVEFLSVVDVMAGQYVFADLGCP